MSAHATLAAQGYRFVCRSSTYTWVHPATLRAGDVDCTGMDDATFERFVLTGQTELLPIPVGEAQDSDFGDWLEATR